MEEPEKALRRPLIVKIGNDERSRPQSGLHKADIVIEHLAEGGITRFDGVYLCQDFEKIGPVRSARLVDIPLAYMFDGIFAHAGASGGVIWVLENQTIFPRLNECPTGNKPGDPGFERGPREGWPYNTFTDTSILWQIADERGWQRPMRVPPLPFGPLEPTTEVEEINEITIPYFSNNRPSWSWDEEDERYLRFISGTPHLEATTGDQISAANVIVIWAEHKVAVPHIIEDENMQLSIDINLNDEGKAMVLRDGYLIPAHWVWAGTGNMLSFFDEAGKPIPLAVGNSWIEVVPPTLEIETE
jgi:hypothetical protein